MFMDDDAKWGDPRATRSELKIQRRINAFSGLPSHVQPPRPPLEAKAVELA